MSIPRASVPSRTRATAYDRYPSLAQWRGRILQSTLTATAVLGSIAYVPGVMAAYQAGLWVVVGVDTLAWVLVVGLALARSLPFALRAGGCIAAWLAVAVMLLWIVGPVGSGTIWLLATPVLAALFFGYRGAAAGIALLVLIAVGYWFLLPWHQPGDVLAAGGSYPPEAWFATSGGLLFLAALLSLSIARVLRGLEDSLVELEVSHRRVSETLLERERLQEELLRTQKHSALGTLASGIAHDFNNILVPILVASEEARDEAPPNSVQREHLDHVISSALRARNLIRRILDFSRSADVERRPVAVEPVLREVGALLRSSAPAGIRVEYRLNAPDAHILADPGELHQVLMNLGTNAYLAMKDGGGTLTLRLDRHLEDGTIVIGVDDTGAGIPAELQDRIFDPFFTTRESGAGTGLGLAIVQRLVSSMAGTVDFDSEVGRGTSFVLRFPEVPGDVAVPTESPADHRAPPRGGRPRTVLVVDDEDLVRGMIVVILGRNGYSVREATSPESALRQVHDEPHAFDLVVTDQAMPNVTGLRLAQDLRSIRPDLPIVLVSGHLSPEEIERAAELGIEGLLDKPFSRRALLSVVERALGRSGSRSQEIA